MVYYILNLLFKVLGGVELDMVGWRVSVLQMVCWMVAEHGTWHIVINASFADINEHDNDGVDNHEQIFI